MLPQKCTDCSAFWASCQCLPLAKHYRCYRTCNDTGTLALTPFEGVQGLQRRLDKSGHVQHLAEPAAPLIEALTPATTVFLSDVETDPWTEEQFHDVVARCRRLIITRGAKGVSAYAHDSPDVHVPAQKIKAVDTNGAGDTFATAYMVAMARGRAVEQALVQATWMASRVCLREQECKPACCADAVQEKVSGGEQPQPQARQPPVFLEAAPRPEDAGTAAYV